MALGSSIFDLCKPRREVLAGELPDAIFAADLWDVVIGKAHQDYQKPTRFFAGTYLTGAHPLIL
jgi:predicted AAA+ superfamily ATPase